MDKRKYHLTNFFKGIVIFVLFTACNLEGDIGGLRTQPAPKPVPVLSAPGVPGIYSIGSGTITITWTAVNEALSYAVYISTNGQPPDTPSAIVYSTTAVFTNLNNKSVYYMWVKARDETRSSDFSPRLKGIPWPANEVPAVPEKPVVIPGVSQLTVNWEATGGASSYEVWRGTENNSANAVKHGADVSSTSVTLTGLTNGITYYIWIKAKNTVGTSGYSPVEVGTPKIPTAPPASPAHPVLTAKSREIEVSWQAVELTSSYEVWYGTSSNSAQAQKFGSDITGSVTETVITGLTNGATYYVWIKAKNSAGESGFSPPASAAPSAFTVIPLIPEMPTITDGSRELTVNWQTAEGAQSYEVWTGTTNNSASAVKHGTDISGTSITLTGLNNGTTYYIWIKAKNTVGTSGFSPRANGTPSAYAAVPSAPQAPTVTPGNGQLSLSWQAVEGAGAYEVWAGTANNPASAIKRGDDVSPTILPSLSADITGLTNGTTYYVWIKAKNSVGTSGFGPAGSGIPSSFSVTPQAPTAPAVSIGSAQITVTWTAVEGALAYEIWTGTANNSASAVKNGEDEPSLSRTISGLTNGTTYYIWIKAKNNIGTSGFSPSASGKPIGNASTPTLASGNGQLSVSWTSITGADQYEVFYGTGANPPQTASQTVNATTAAITGLTNGTIYNVWIRGKNSTGNGAMSSSASAKPIGNMGAVSLVSGNGQLSLSWPSVAGADQYEVYHSTSNSIPASPTQTVNAPATTATITGLTNGTTYYVWVRAKNANGSSTSAVVSAAPMTTPGNLTVSAANQQITVSWTAVPGASSYEVYRSTNTTIPSSPSDTVTTLNHTFTGLTNGTTYYFWVKAVNANGTSGASPTASGKPVGNMGAVTLVSGNDQLSLSWSTVAGADQYEVYYSTGNSIPANPSQTVNAPTTTATITGLTNGTTYYVWVKAKNGNGTGAESTVVSGKPIGNIGGVVTLIPGSNQLTASWSAVPGADQYEVYHSTSNSIPGTPSQTVTATTATISGLTNDTTYYVWVKPKNANGTGAASSSSSVTIRPIIPLTENVWTDGSITSTASGSAAWYSFNVVSGTTYRIWWNDKYDGDDSKTGDVKVSAYYSSGTSIFTGYDSGWSSSYSFTASTSGTVTIKVEPYFSSNTGTFAVAYSTSNIRPLTTYTVTFNANSGNGTTPSVQTVSEGSSITLPSGSGLSRSGYTFGGWNTNTSGTGTNYNADSSYTPTGSITLYAKWDVITYIVTYDINGGSGTTPSVQTVNIGNSVTLASGSGLSRTNYAFGGWNTNTSGTGTNYSADSSYTPTGSITLYAKWDAAGTEANPIPLTASTWADGSITSTTSGSAIWYSFSVTSGTTYYVWLNDTDASQGKTLDAKVSAYYSNGTSIFTGIDAGWSTPRSFSASSSGTVKIKVEPYFSSNTGTFAVAYNTSNNMVYTVTFNANSGSGTAPSAQTVAAGSSITLPSGSGLSRSGYTFGGWNTNTSGTGTNYNAGSSYTPTGSITLYAKWNTAYTVTFNANSGSGTTPSAQTAAVGSSITLPSGSGLTRTNYTFGGWNTNTSGTGTNYSAGSSYTPTGNVTLYARWIVSYEMVYVPGGSFEMGAALGPEGGVTQSPVRTVTLSGFYMGKYEVTQAQYEAVMGKTIEEQRIAASGLALYGVGDNYPMYYVNWYEALVFCNKLSVLEGLTPAYRISGSTDPAAWGTVPTSSNATWNAVEVVSGSTGYRLPTEAQWEYTAKGGNGTPGNYSYSGSNNIDEVAWYLHNSNNGTNPVGTKAPNGLGTYDMSGNVREWCWDWDGDYPNMAQTNPTGASSGSFRVHRGASWESNSGSPSSYRASFGPSTRMRELGFRLVRP